MARARIGWRSGGLLIGLALALVLVAVGWRVTWMMRGTGAIGGAGHGAADHGFDLSTSVVPPGQIVPSGVPRGGIPALVAPPTMPASEVAVFNEQHRGKYLVHDDPVIGVVAGGAARAYPIRVLDWHETVNDVLGGIPLLITRSPLSLSAAVYERRVDGEVREFGNSGLLLQSNTLLFDRAAEGASSLWAQLDGLAIAGPAAAAGSRLRPLPASLARWSDWVELHPDTDVLRPDPDRFKRYQRNPYGSYRSRGRPRFPVEPLPPADGPALMAPLLLLDGPGGEQAWLLPGSSARPVIADLDGRTVEIRGVEPPLSILVDDSTPARYAAWFAWYARHGAGSRPREWPDSPASIDRGR